MGAELSNSQILLDSPNDSYYSGTNVTGRLTFRLDKPKKVKAVECNIRGRAKTSWHETEHVSNHNHRNRGTSERRSVTYFGNEEIFSNKYNLFGGPDSETELEPGDYVYPFSTQLPPNIPPSFEGPHGNIRYSVTVTLVRPWKLDQHVKKVFTVHTPVDLNYNQKATEPVKLQVEKYFCCCWCRSGPLTMVVNLPYSGFVPGQNIPVTVEVDNASNVRVDTVSVKLIQVLKFIARTPRHKERKDNADIVVLNLDPVEARGSQTFIQQISVPSTPLCNIDQCSIINRSYDLQVTADVSGCHVNLHATVPIFLGTVPLRQSSAFPPPMYQTPAFPPLGAPDQIPSAPPEVGHPPVGFTTPGLPGDNMFPTLPFPSTEGWRVNSSHEQLIKPDQKM